MLEQASRRFVRALGGNRARLVPVCVVTLALLALAGLQAWTAGAHPLAAASAKAAAAAPAGSGGGAAGAPRRPAGRLDGGAPPHLVRMEPAAATLDLTRVHRMEGAPVEPQGEAPVFLAPEPEARAQAAGTVTILDERFEVTFPGTTWTLYGSDTTGWGTTTYKRYEGAKSAWCAAGGSSPAPPGGPYVANMAAWMVYGPFSLADATAARAVFQGWLDTEENYDYANWFVSLDGSQFYGFHQSGSSGGWTQVTFNFADVTDITVIGAPQVWFAFYFDSDADIQREGAYVDALLITKDTGAACSVTLSKSSDSFAAAGGTQSVNVTADAACTWTATSDSTSWLTVTSGASGAGNGVVQYAATANGGAARSGIITIKDKTLTVQQAAAGGPSGTTYTTNADFDLGILNGLEHTTVADQLQLTAQSSALPYIWVPNSNQGTISKVDTSTGKELARYRTVPANVTGDPSRTTVDIQGNCWLGNRQAGTLIKVGLFEAGQCVDRNGNGTIETSQDTNNDGDIQGAELLDWGQDECVLKEVVLIPGSEGTYTPGQYTGAYSSAYYPRAVGIDASNNVWAGTYYNNKAFYVNGATGAIVRSVDLTSTGTRPYGAVVDRYGKVWFASWDSSWVLKLDPSAGDALTKVTLDAPSYGLGLDKNDHLFVSSYNGKLMRINVATGTVDWQKDAPYGSKGVAVTDDGDVWVADEDSAAVTRFANDGTAKGQPISVSAATGVAVDKLQRVWAVGTNSSIIKRIDPATSQVDLSKDIISGTTHYGYSDMTGIVARGSTTRIGNWTVIHDSAQANTEWGRISWNGSTPAGTSITCRARSSADQTSWSSWAEVLNNVVFTAVPKGRYLQLEVTLQLTAGQTSPILYDLTLTPGRPSGQLDANFTYTPASPTVNQAVQFTDTSTGGPTSWSWTFDDGGTSNGQNPQHTFTTAGTFQVKLTVTNASGSDNVTKSVTVANQGACNATRTLPGGYVAGSPFQVTIQVVPPAGSGNHALEDSPPTGWAVSGIDGGGTWDSINAKVKWGPFFDTTTRTLHYSVTPPAGTTGTFNFSGVLSVDGVSQPICGATSISPGAYHPADTSSNWRIEINEATAYGAAWKQGQTWPRPPNPIPIDYVTNAGYLWKQGEVYHYDPTKTPPWTPGAPAAMPPSFSVSTLAVAFASTAVCAFNPTSYTAGSPVQVSIVVTPDQSTQVYAVEDAPPAGWTVSGIDNGGSWDAVNGKVKWGPYFDSSARTLGYAATPPAGTTGAKTFAGVASFDGSSVPITGARTISPGGQQQGYSYWFLVTSHAGGLQGSQWRSDVGLLNRSSDTATVELRLYTGATVKTKSLSIAAGGQEILVDVVGGMSYNGSAAMEVRSDQPLLPSSRTYNQSATGTFGQNYDAATTAQGLAAGASGWLPQLTENSAYRTNIAFTNTGTTAASLTTTLYDGTGTVLTTYDVSLNPGEWKQETRPFSGKAHQSNLAKGYAKVTVNTGSGIIGAASVVDNVTNDPTTIPLLRQ